MAEPESATPESAAPESAAHESAAPETATQAVQRLVGVASSIVAPLSVISGLLFYYGYVWSRARYDYFGVDVDTVGLSTQDYVMRSPQPLLTPLLALAVLAAAFAVLHAALRRRLDALVEGAASDDEAVVTTSRRGLVRARRLARSTVLAGQLAVLGGVVLLFGYAWLSGWAPYMLATPLLLAAGTALAGYGLHVEAVLGRHERPRRAGLVAAVVVLTASLLWATATVAQWTGRGSARELAVHLEDLPGVILDTSERLYLTTPQVRESALPAAEGQTFHFRYRDLRLLVQGKDHLFLVPEKWSASNSTIMVPTADSGYRVQFRFQNDPPT